MPELAEVETLRRDLREEFSGRRIERVTASGRRSVRRHAEPAEFERAVVGATITGFDRTGKYLLMRLDRGTTVVAHMGMSGQLLLMDSGTEPPRHTHVAFGFDRGPDLRFVDPRTFGQMFAVPTGPGPSPAALAHIGFDPLEDPDAWPKLDALLSGRPTRLKPLLMDQSRVAGIGNMYADEILHRAGLHPGRPARSLGPAERRALYDAAVEVLGEAVDHRGSSLADEQYRDLYGRVGGFQKLHRVYAREGLPCPACGQAVSRQRWSGRSSFFCPRCQR